MASPRRDDTDYGVFEAFSAHLCEEFQQEARGVWKFLVFSFLDARPKRIQPQ